MSCCARAVLCCLLRSSPMSCHVVRSERDLQLLPSAHNALLVIRLSTAGCPIRRARYKLSTLGSYDLNIDGPAVQLLLGAQHVVVCSCAVAVHPQHAVNATCRQMAPAAQAANMSVDDHIEALRHAPKGTMVQLEGGAPPSTASEPAECLAESIVAAKAAQAPCPVGADTYDFSGAYGGADSSGCSDVSHGRSQKSGVLQLPQLGDADGANGTAPRNDQSSGDSFKTAPSQIEAPSRAGASQAVQQSPAALPLLPSPGCRSTRCKAGTYVSIHVHGKRLLLLHANSGAAKCMRRVVQDPRCQNCSMMPTVCTCMSKQHQVQGDMLAAVPSSRMHACRGSVRCCRVHGCGYHYRNLSGCPRQCLPGVVLSSVQIATACNSNQRLLCRLRATQPNYEDYIDSSLSQLPESEDDGADFGTSRRRYC
jgi:hypothetical protein